MKKKTKIKKRKIVQKKAVRKHKKILRTKKIKVTQEQIDAIIKKGEERGFVTTSEILHFIPSVEHNVDELESTFDLLRERGVEIKEVREFLEVKSKKEKKAKK